MSAPVKDILLITNYYHFEEEKGSSRYRSLAELLASDDSLSLELVTSDFYHQTKKFRTQEYMARLTNELPFRVSFCHERGYSRNISPARLLSCRSFASGVMAYLKKRKLPDLIYLVVPSLDVADAVSAYAEAKGVPLIIDVQDLWPEAFRMALDVPVVSDILFYPMLRKAERIYSRADSIVAVSETYAKRALSVNSKCREALAVYIGSDEEYINSLECEHSVQKPEGELWICYAGALGHSYDISTVINALAVLREREALNGAVFHVMGDGVLRERFQREAEEKGIKAVFHGFLEYGKMMAMLRAADIAVNPIVGKSVSSIINKVSDYAFAGIPVVNSQNSSEYRRLIEEYQCGINCKSEDSESMADAIEKLLSDFALRKVMGENSARLAQEKFNRRNTYPEIAALIKKYL